jgi:signal transduction histidine kinase
VEQNGVNVKVKIKDDGIGMTPDERDRAFDEFFRAKNKYTANVPGTGLGLSLVKRLVELHQGEITVKTKPGEGSEFTVSIPIME